MEFQRCDISATVGISALLFPERCWFQKSFHPLSFRALRKWRKQHLLVVNQPHQWSLYLVWPVLKPYTLSVVAMVATLPQTNKSVRVWLRPSAESRYSRLLAPRKQPARKLEYQLKRLRCLRLKEEVWVPVRVIVNQWPVLTDWSRSHK